MKDLKEKVHKIKAEYAKKDKKLGTLMILLLIIAYAVTYFNFWLAVFIGCMAFIIPIVFSLKNKFSEIDERLDLLGN